MRIVKPKLFATRAEYLDPIGCDSFIGYNIVRTRRGRFHATVDLGDCNRKIQWFFGKENTSLEKIDRAIAVLDQFRKDFTEARQQNGRRGKAAR